MRGIPQRKEKIEINGFQIASQIIGIILFIAVIAIGQMKNIKLILVSELVCNTLTVINYLLVGDITSAENINLLMTSDSFLSAMSVLLTGGIAAAMQCFVALVQALVSYLYTSKEKKFPLWLTVVFLAVYIAVFIPTYTSPKDLLTLAACILYCLAMVQKTSKGYRMFITPNAVLWLVFDLLVGAYTTAITHGFMFVSNVIGIIRHDIRKKPTEVK